MSTITTTKPKNPVHKIKVNYHEAHQSIEDICILGAGLSMSNVDEATKNAARRINAYLQKIWDASLNAQFPKSISPLS